MEADRNVAKFSRGMQQRIGLAQALMNDPELLILDEPTSALDPLARVAMRELLLEANRAGKTIFLSSHLALGDRDDLPSCRHPRQGPAGEAGQDRGVAGVARPLRGCGARSAGRQLRASRSCAMGRSMFTVPAASQRDALERVWALGGEVLSVNPVRRTLEEVFVELTNNGSERVRPVLLIAANFLREHRWPVLILFAWIVLTAAGCRRISAGAARWPMTWCFTVQQQAIYICVFSAFLAADAIHNERKSRRILLVLSKAISRGEYLLAVILGTCAMAIAYALVFGLCGVWLDGAGCAAERTNSGRWWCW